jgi:hypothetical protein
LPAAFAAGLKIFDYAATVYFLGRSNPDCKPLPIH